MNTSSITLHDHRVVALRETVADLAARPPAAREFLDEVEHRLRRVIPFDGGDWWTSDPETLLPMELRPFEYPALQYEVAANDVNRLDDLDRQSRTVSTLGLTMPGERARSARFDDHYRLPGAGDQMRVLARNGGWTWGAACLYRGADLPDFTRDEVAVISAVSRDVGLALRTDLLRTVRRDGTGWTHQAPGAHAGTVVVDRDDRVLGYTPEGGRWLERLGVALSTDRLPASLRWITLQARTHERLSDGGMGIGMRPLRQASSRLRTTTGELVTVRADVLRGAVDQAVVLALEPASGPTMWPLLVALHGLTRRETELAALLVAGRSIKDIATDLHLSVHTVRDHVKAVYTKVGISSRPELTAQLGRGPGVGPGA
ncbi:LuxR C-terminal-related transcriptional regulator [Promicromonospora thailandica]|uniref:helix-turn-helix transcriptional regulator n=1 Tax=Promicromonospora thailandica TaxID=765201 RepID=UPI0020A45C46|nr:helix-turn-helix transcriptional regulator [Promicromonospora thailandica]